MQIINPATEEIITEIQADNVNTLSAKFQRLQNAQPAWEETSLQERIDIVMRFSDLLVQNI